MKATIVSSLNYRLVDCSFFLYHPASTLQHSQIMSFSSKDFAGFFNCQEQKPSSQSNLQGHIESTHPISTDQLPGFKHHPVKRISLMTLCSAALPGFSLRSLPTLFLQNTQQPTTCYAFTYFLFQRELSSLKLENRDFKPFYSSHCVSSTWKDT